MLFRSRFVLDLRQQLELPDHATGRFHTSLPLQSRAARVPPELDADQPHTLELEPFEVLTLELIPSLR